MKATSTSGMCDSCLREASMEWSEVYLMIAVAGCNVHESVVPSKQGVLPVYQGANNCHPSTLVGLKVKMLMTKALQPSAIGFLALYMAKMPNITAVAASSTACEGDIDIARIFHPVKTPPSIG